MRNRFKPVCGVVDGSAACSDSSNTFVTFGSTAAGLTAASVELVISNDWSAGGDGVLANGDNRPRDANN